jgi:putative transport protein
LLLLAHGTKLAGYDLGYAAGL